MKRSASNDLHNKRQKVEEFSHTAASTWTGIGDCSMTIGVTEIAIKAYDFALNYEESNLDAIVGLSKAVRVNDVQRNEGFGSKQLIEKINSNLQKYKHLQRSYEIHRELSECYLVLGFNEQAHRAAQASIELNAKDPFLWLLNAQTLLRAGAKKEAANSLIRCLSLFPQRIEQFSKDDVETARAAHAELGAIYASDGDIDTAISELTVALSLPPPSLARMDEYVALWCALATAKERANDLQGAIETCEKAQIIVGNSDRVLITHAYLLLIGNNPKLAGLAIALLHRVVSHEVPTPLFLHGNTNDEKAVEAGSEGDFLPWYLLGKAYASLKSPRLAYDCFQIALTRASSFSVTWLAVGSLYLELKQLPDALAAYSQALRWQVDENSWGTATAWDGLSCVYERSNDQMIDASDACNKASKSYLAIGDRESALYFEKRAESLVNAFKTGNKIALREPPEVPHLLIRDIIALLPVERMEYINNLHKNKTVSSHPNQNLSSGYSDNPQNANHNFANQRNDTTTREGGLAYSEPQYIGQQVYQHPHVGSPSTKWISPAVNHKPVQGQNEQLMKLQGVNSRYSHIIQGGVPIGGDAVLGRSPNSQSQYFRGVQYAMDSNMMSPIIATHGPPLTLPPPPHSMVQFLPGVQMPQGVVYGTPMGAWKEA